jgi:hypothetical protein
MSSTWLATPHRGGKKNWHNRATTSGGEYSITDDGRVRPKHVLIELRSECVTLTDKRTSSQMLAKMDKNS